MRRIIVLTLTAVCLISNSISILNSYKQHKPNPYKSSLIHSIDSVMRVVAPDTQLSGAELLALCDEYDMDLFFVLAQGQLESHFGTRGLASKTNSVFNVLAYDGRTYNQICKNGKYENPNHSIEPYIKLLKTKYLVNGRTVDDLLKNFVDVSGHRYASDPKYERTLRSIYRKYSQIDSLVNTYNLYKQYSASVII